MTFAKGLNWLSLAIAVGAVGAWFMDFPVLWGAGLGVVVLVWAYFKNQAGSGDDSKGSKSEDDSSSGIDVSDVLDIFDGD